MDRKKYINKIVSAAVIAGVYAGLTYFGGFMGLGYGQIQLRLSEALTVLAVFSPTAVYGLTVGCFLANIASFNPLDMIFGTAATLISALLSYRLRNIKIGKIPFLSVLSPVIINGIIIGAELSVLVSVDISFPIMMIFVAVGEAVSCFGLGIPLYMYISKNKQKFNKFLIDF